MLDRRSILNFDWILFLAVMVIASIGVVTIYSATAAPFYIKQMIWVAIGLISLFLILSIDYRKISRYSYPLYGLSILLLILVLFIGKSGMGAQRWFSIGPISFQPSELAKVTLIIALARFLSEERKGPLSIKHLLLPGFFFLLLPLILVLKQPDLGTALLIIVVFITMVLMAGIRWRSLLFLILPAILTSPAWGGFLWGSLKDYQKNRILVFLDPDVDPLGISYHIAQSKIAIGSGKIFGKGYLAGTQGQLRFLPERHTDFIFSVFAEEWGFIGSIFLLSLYLFLILWGIEIANKAKDRLGSLMAIGVVSVISFYVIVNIGMTVGLMPVVGIPLPFLSYGGTSVVTAFMSIGILMNVKMRRFMLFY
jgi:rod shape determining protein RodA